MAGITLKNIYKRYQKDVVAVKDFSLEIQDKEFIILVGPSGCGKSTTLRMIAGLEEISEGELYIGDRLMNDVAAKDRDIAMVFQNYALYPHMTVYKNMAFGLEMRKEPKGKIKEKVEEAAKILDIKDLLNRRPKELSGGQRQRVALGRAMVRHPSVFLLDEPLSNLDAKLRTQMRTEIAKLHKKLGTTFVYVTHDQVEAMTMGDRIVVMKDGVIQQVDNPQNLYDCPVNIFVAGFMGSPQMNFFEASVGKAGLKYFLDFKGRRIPVSDIKAACGVLEEYVGKTVIAGIRSEDITCDAAFIAANALEALPASVELSELLGAEVHLHLSCEGQKLIARVPSHEAPQADEEIRIAYNINKLHLFDKETEKVIVN